MSAYELVIEAIQARKPIRFEYNKPGKVTGVRTGNPHIIFSGTTKEGISRTWVHIAQTSGVSDSGGPFPEWRMFILDHISNGVVLAEEPCFDPHSGYNPGWDGYTHIIERV